MKSLLLILVLMVSMCQVQAEPCSFSITATGPVTLMPKNQAEVISVVGKQLSSSGCAWVNEQNAKYRLEFGYWCFLNAPVRNPSKLLRFTRHVFDLVFGQEQGINARVRLRDGSLFSEYEHRFFAHRVTFEGVERVMMKRAEQVLGGFIEEIQAREQGQ